jgi:hypothetical protein
LSDFHINIFWSDEDGGYVADIPDLDSCSAFGETPDRLLLTSNWPRPGGSRQLARPAVPYRNLGTVRRSTPADVGERRIARRASALYGPMTRRV